MALSTIWSFAFSISGAFSSLWIFASTAEILDFTASIFWPSLNFSAMESLFSYCSNSLESLLFSAFMLIHSRPLLLFRKFSMDSLNSSLRFCGFGIMNDWMTLLKLLSFSAFSLKTAIRSSSLEILFSAFLMLFSIFGIRFSWIALIFVSFALMIADTAPGSLPLSIKSCSIAFVASSLAAFSSSTAILFSLLLIWSCVSAFCSWRWSSVSIWLP